MLSPIIITEIPRSGADMVAQALVACGVWIGDGVVRESDRSSFWNKEIQTTLVRPMLRGMHADAVGVVRFPELKQCHEVAPFVAESWRRRIEQIVTSQGCPDHNEDGPQFWGYVGADAAMLWPVWQAAFPNAQWIIVRRQPSEIIASCLKNAYHGKIHDKETLAAWIGRFDDRFESMRGALHVQEVWPVEFIRGDLGNLRTAITNLGLTWDEGKVGDALTPVLWGNGVFEMKGAV